MDSDVLTCAECGRRFLTIQTLTRHLESHRDKHIHQCKICGAGGFARADHLKRHMKSHIEAHKDKPVQRCEICGADGFGRADNLTRHMKKHDRENELKECGTCGKKFARVDHLKNHVKTHIRSEKEKKISSEDEIENQEVRPEPALIDLLEMDPEIFPTELGRGDPALTEVLYQHWTMFKTHHILRPHRIQDVYNFRLKSTDLRELNPSLMELYRRQRYSFKINASFGYVLRHIESGRLRYFHSSLNNNRILDSPVFVRNEEQFKQFTTAISEEEDIFEQARRRRPDTKWRVFMVTNVTFFINKIKSTPIGGVVKLPGFITFNRGLNNVIPRQENNLCFFNCLAFHRNAREIFKTGKKLCLQWGKKYCNFPGVTLEQIPSLEDCFKIKVTVYELNEQKEVRLVRRSFKHHDDHMILNLHGNHFSYVTDIKKYAKMYICRKCDEILPYPSTLLRHEASCSVGIKEKCVGGVYSPRKTIFEDLESVGIIVPHKKRFNRYRVCFDFECYFNTANLPKTSAKTLWHARHVPISVGVNSNVPGHQEAQCIVDGDPTALINQFMDYLTCVKDAAMASVTESLKQHYNDLLVLIHLEEEKNKNPEKKSSYLKRLNELKRQLDQYIDSLVILGFNSGSYDLNVILKYLVEYAMTRGYACKPIKNGSRFISLKIGGFHFLDILNYLPAGASYDDFIKAYSGGNMRKFYFPYEWMTGVDKLNYTRLPDHESFYSSLKGRNISREEYELCCKVWKEEKMETFKQYLEYYNLVDVKPFKDAVDKQFEFYENLGIDMFREAQSVPGVTLKYMFQNKDAFFTLVDEYNKDLFHKIKDNIVGGPSIVFHREHESGRTKIKEIKYGSDSEVCAHIMGWDANSLYLSCMMKPHPGGWAVRRSAPNFKPERVAKFGWMCATWLEYISEKTGLSIQHSFNGNGKETRLGSRQLPVDGFCQQQNLVYQIHGCIWHSHRCHLTKFSSDETPHPIFKDKTHGEVRRDTAEKTEYLKSLGYDVIEKFECEWEKLRTTDEDVKAFLAKQETNKIKQNTLSETQILNFVRKGAVFGMIEVDLHVPPHLRERFKEFPPIFKNVEISKEDIGPHMKDFCEKKGVFTRPRRALISSYHAKKILLSTPLLAWYLSHGLECTKVYEIIEYDAKTCFREFGERVSEYRRTGDSDPDKKMFSDLFKTMGNASYGKTLTSKITQLDVVYADDFRTTKLLSGHRFKQLTEIGRFHEVQLTKKIVYQDLPIQIGAFVYWYAKLRLLEFYYDFLQKYIPDNKFQLMECDTDSIYAGVASDTLETLVDDSLKKTFYKDLKNWIPVQACSVHYDQFVNDKLSGRDWKPSSCCIRQYKFDTRTPGLFKLEAQGKRMICLNSKSYILDRGEEQSAKISCKGISKRLNTLEVKDYKNVLDSQCPTSGENRGFRRCGDEILTYSQTRDGLSYLYIKRKVLSDGISTEPLDI